MTSQAAYILALDLGTTGNRAILFDRSGQMVSQAYRELTQYYPQPGWVEHDPRQIWQDTTWAMQSVIAKAQISPQQIAAIGMAVQRETCLLWDATTGRPLHNAIVWQDRRTAPQCQQLAEAGYAPEIYQRTGLTLDAYFSATKLRWLLDQVQQNDPLIDWQQVRAGTIDTWILWNLTRGQVHATDHSNASRTLLMNLPSCTWDDWLLDRFQVPRAMLPTIQPSLGLFGVTDVDFLNADIPIMAMLGDQQAALFAHGCNQPGLLKCTYGTGCFLVAHTGSQIPRSHYQLLSTIAWTTTTTTEHPIVGYALEGSMFTTGACIQWLRDGLQMITTAADTEALALQAGSNGGVYFVPALSGLGTPHWDMTARGAFLGITAGVRREHFVRAVLESIAYQVKEVVQAVQEDMGTSVAVLKVDGGACHNNFLMQFQADVLGIPVERPAFLEATAQGAAFAAGLAIGFWQDYDALIQTRQIDRCFEPSRQSAEAIQQFDRWQEAVRRAKHWAVQS
ncbi:MAG: glycerol kinase GlpK [Elainella sp. Prado103]|jgi:glycerol kinase|nr:glycerol kinase GlpK [Elainella sp. Prado103]